jgi:hypothetical protein
MLLVCACGGDAAAAEDEISGDDVSTGADAPPAPPPLARVLARYGCEEDGWTLTYTIDEHERACDDGSTTAPLSIVQRPGEADGPQRFTFALGSERGEGQVCRAPASCADAEHTLEIIGGEPPRVEWSLSLSDESIEHGSGAVLLCNEAPPPPCEL